MSPAPSPLRAPLRFLTVLPYPPNRPIPRERTPVLRTLVSGVAGPPSIRSTKRGQPPGMSPVERQRITRLAPRRTSA